MVASILLLLHFRKWRTVGSVLFSVVILRSDSHSKRSIVGARLSTELAWLPKFRVLPFKVPIESLAYGWSSCV